jgi:Zn-dependent protease with chaperone function
MHKSGAYFSIGMQYSGCLILLGIFRLQNPGLVASVINGVLGLQQLMRMQYSRASYSFADRIAALPPSASDTPLNLVFE